MCRSAAEGGQRCSHHARKVVARAQRVHEEARRAHEANPSRETSEATGKAYDDLIVAQEDLASTRTGLAEARAAAEDRAASAYSRLHAESLVEVGEFLSRRNAALRAGLEDARLGRPLFGGTGDEATDEALRAAVAVVAANLDGCRMGSNKPFVKVPVFATVKRQAADVVRRVREVKRSAADFSVWQGEVAADEADAVIDETTRFARADTYRWLVQRRQVADRVRWRNMAATDVVLAAHRLAQSRAQTPPDPA